MILVVASAVVFVGCSSDAPPAVTGSANYLDNAGRDDVLSGGVKMIPVETPKGIFRVWTKGSSRSRST